MLDNKAIIERIADLCGLTIKEFEGTCSSYNGVIITQIPAMICELWREDTRWCHGFGITIEDARHMVVNGIIVNWNHSMREWEIKHIEKLTKLK